MLRIRRLAPAIAVLAAGSPTLAHGDTHDTDLSWTFDPWVAVPLAILLAVFLIGRQRLASRSKVDRKRPWLFLGGWLLLTLSLVSPLHHGGEQSFTLHMIEHELIMLAATFLLAASHAGGVIAWGLPAPLRRGLGGGWKAPIASLWHRLTDPITATIVQSLVMWVWHAPALFDRALASQGWHVAQHLSFVISSLLFWTAMLDTRLGGYLLSAACLFVTSLVEGALGALMALSASPWYPAYAAMGVTGIKLDPTADQQLAGLIMWIPGGLVHGGAALGLLYQWLKANEDSHGLPSH
ncbi:cytochrome c oxidase assembly protein [Sphingomonas daechungensis]|uniref:cytochrome c oxidase assembly protein n=1 Tax=Sphingomonas daechungensis TaxID=1176646 RepID=UPI003784420E